MLAGDGAATRVVDVRQWDVPQVAVRTKPPRSEAQLIFIGLYSVRISCIWQEIKFKKSCACVLTPLVLHTKHSWERRLIVFRMSGQIGTFCEWTVSLRCTNTVVIVAWGREISRFSFILFEKAFYTWEKFVIAQDLILVFLFVFVV